MANRDVGPGFRGVLAVPEFRALWAAEAQSLLGDQMARVALAVLAFDRTGSSTVTGVVYALTFMPALIGGATLSHLADRLPRRGLMIACDLIRAALLGLMAYPGLPLAVVCCLLVLTVLAGRPFAASQIALLPEILAGDAYVLGSGLRLVSDQVAQLIGFVAGGFVVAAVGARSCLLIDAATFLVSAVVLRAFVQHRPAPNSTLPAERPTDRSLHSTLTLILGEPRLRLLIALGALAGLHVVPEGVAPSYAAAAGGGAVTVSLLMASLPLGTAIGASVVVRIAPQTRDRLIGPMAVAAAVPLVACILKPDLAMSIALWSLSGLFAAYQVPASASFVRAIPDRRRGQVVGLAASVVLAAQGLGVVIFGFVAEHSTATTAVGLAGAFALILAGPLAAKWSTLIRAERSRPAGSIPPSGDGEGDVAGDF